MGETDAVVRLVLTDDCHLRLLEEADAQELHRLVEANRAYLAEWMPWAAEQTFEGTAEFVRKTGEQLQRDNGFQAVLVCDGRIVGSAGYHAINRESNSTSLGYWLDEAHQGRGLMTMAVRALTDHAFEDWRLNRIEIHAAAGNLRSRAIPERLGFQQEGVLREHKRVGDRYLDIVAYSLLARERQR
jgi:ribosomal-protein-serine acetyltransferase